ncbi:hypothetical protein [Streptomyces sp. AK02-01A]|uniref:hypothetical protein n=1 Tax=Streptomyces sp. AK02-01A TaxID=3028648 RepID=UPI0029B163F7|nr:hypothetical protein [Streptomyces sp. AK02-01A]MDX3850853.1 hypothetical protein [Streptomyces sp. AK02-01A]
MDLVQVFADLDVQPWADMRHASGSAADVPGALRALAHGDLTPRRPAARPVPDRGVRPGRTGHRAPRPLDGQSGFEEAIQRAW